MRIIIIPAILLIALLVAGCAQSGNNATGGVTQNTDDSTGGNGNVGSTTKTIKITGENFKFTMGGVDNPDIVVNKGDTVRIEFSSVGGFHDWVVDEFNARTQQVNPGTPTSVEFVADKTGEFEYYCSVMQHRQMGMRGKLIVK